MDVHSWNIDSTILIVNTQYQQALALTIDIDMFLNKLHICTSKQIVIQYNMYVHIRKLSNILIHRITRNTYTYM